VASNTVKRHPRAKAKLTLSELVNKFWEFIDKYHNEVHSVTKMTPLAFWAENCHARPVNPRRLDILLKERARRKVIKKGIKYRGRIYWHTALGEVVGESVLIRSGPSYAAPDEIEVFHDDRWICTAFAIDSERGLAVTRDEVRAAQRAQSQAAQNTIDKARQAIEDADREIEERNKNKSAPDTIDEPPESKEKPKPKKSRRRKPNLLDRMKN
jgi:hypothetical protein